MLLDYESNYLRNNYPNQFEKLTEFRKLCLVLSKATRSNLKFLKFCILMIFTPCEPCLNVLLSNVASPAFSFSQCGSFHTSWEPMLNSFIRIRIARKLRLNSDGHAGGRRPPACPSLIQQRFCAIRMRIYKLSIGSHLV